jgi:alpha-beta hydrolase superfamily lysophospholipase
VTTSPPLAAADGTPLHLHRWPGGGTRGTVLIVHGLGEHIGRYEHVAAWLGARGWQVVGYDQRGHGRSGGARGVIPAVDSLRDDLGRVVDVVRPVHGPLVLLGHSMGGAVAAHFVAERRRAVDGLVLTSPALAADLSLVQRIQLWMGERVAPALAQGNGLDPQMIAHAPEVVRAYLDDPLVHDRISARLARATLDAGDVARARAAEWAVPTLLLYAGADRLVAPRGSDAFAASAPREVVETERFDALYHEILNEGTLAAPVFARLEQWLDARFPA